MVQQVSRPRETLADGEEIVGDLIAVMDETTPHLGAGVYYVLTTAVTMAPGELTAAIHGLFSDTPGRTRPFHWITEGVTAKQRMIDIIIDSGVVAISRHQSVGRKSQNQAREILIKAIADDLAREKIDHLVIESGDRSTNARDKAALLDHFRADGGVPFTYDWRSKKEPLLWIADAINGAIHAHLTGGDQTWFEQLQAGDVLGRGPVYTN